MKERIISISGRPGLYQLVKQGRGMLIVESLDGSHHRTSVGSTDKVMSLNDISIYCNDDDTLLTDVFAKIKAAENAEPLKFNARKAGAAELRDYFAKVLPEYDRDRVHDSDIRKLLQWYDILVQSGITDFEEEKPSDPESPAE